MAEFDLSIPFVIGFANVVAAQLTGDQMNFALVCVIVAVLSAGIGAFNGALSSFLAIHPLIVTLGVGTTVQGIVLLWTGGTACGLRAGRPDGIRLDWRQRWTTADAMADTELFRRGDGPRHPACANAVRSSALRSGEQSDGGAVALINVRAMWTITYALSALFAATAGILLLGFTGSAYGDVGQPYLFQTVAAVVIGGTTLVGGRGGLVGTIAGAAVLIEINTLLIGLGLAPSAVEATLGIVIILLVSLYGREPHVSTTI